MKGFREWLREKILFHYSRTRGRSDWLQRLSRPAMLAYLSLSVMFFVEYRLGLMTGAYVAYVGFVYMILLITLGSIVVVHQITVYGKWYAVFFIGLLIVMTLLIFLFTPRYLLT
jgi:hypothetical protein